MDSSPCLFPEAQGGGGGGVVGVLHGSRNNHTLGLPVFVQILYTYARLCELLHEFLYEHADLLCDPTVSGATCIYISVVCQMFLAMFNF